MKKHAQTNAEAQKKYDCEENKKEKLFFKEKKLGRCDCGKKCNQSNVCQGKSVKKENLTTENQKKFARQNQTLLIQTQKITVIRGK